MHWGLAREEPTPTAVLVDQASDEVLAGSKALTTSDGLSIGVGQVVAAVI